MSTWTVTRIKAKIRELTGRPNEVDISESELLNKINDYYVDMFPQEVMVKEYVTYFEFDTVDGTGTKTISDIDSDIINLTGPVYLDGDEISLWTDDRAFFDEYPHSETTEGEPTDILIFGNTLYIRPIPDDAYTVRIKSLAQKPDAFTSDDDTPDDNKWGPIIALGTAMEILMNNGEENTAATLDGLYETHRISIVRKQIQREPVGKTAARSF